MRRLAFSAPLLDLLLAPFVLVAAVLLKSVRRIGVRRLPVCKNLLFRVGVFPIRRHYYEPLFDSRSLAKPIARERELPGIDWNIEEQLSLLDSFRFGAELKEDVSQRSTRSFDFDNAMFKSGDAEYLYNLIRLKRPSRIYEVGSGYSTLMAARAVERNRKDDPAYQCEHTCVEPYENPWLEGSGLTVIRERVERVDKTLFAGLGRDDLLFIDSSHVIRPQGDVLFEYLEIIPALAPGVIVHVHDVFSPRDYPDTWIKDDVVFCNEQYLLEAFLSGNRDWKIIGALNLLHHRYYDRLAAQCPYLTPDREPGSLYMQRLG